eukprot:m.465294 g.465294  ORF g.465294 m.465294 type:complete len:98 (-) comp57048_c3_seq1:470-763(-)
MTWCVLASRFGQPLLFFLVATRQDNGVRPRLAYAEDLILVARAPPPPVHQPYMPAPAYSAAPPPVCFFLDPERLFLLLRLLPAFRMFFAAIDFDSGL